MPNLNPIDQQLLQIVSAAQRGNISDVTQSSVPAGTTVNARGISDIAVRLLRGAAYSAYSADSHAVDNALRSTRLQFKYHATLC